VFSASLRADSLNTRLATLAATTIEAQGHTHRPQPFNERHGLLLSASPSMAGGNRGLWALRIPFEHLGARMYPDMFSLAQAHRAFDESGRIGDAELQRRFDTTIANFLSLVEAAVHYPCVKRAWVEYLGEHPDPAIDRVDLAAAAPAPQ
ncbi:MAG TPA: hypothetical protein VMO88_15625, partial [Acidimicrobiales bacterium]|nr:hypothetical protein [Acidimicrobiales bacterium]